MSTDYAKWENLALDGDDDDDIVDAVNEKRSQLQRNKRFADEAFLRAENSNSESTHQKALLVYEMLLTEIDEAYGLLPLVPYLDELFFSCQLNAACCCIRLGQWDGAIAYCNGLLTTKYFNLLKALQLIRISYFKCRALLSKESTNTSSVTQRQLNKEVTVFKELLSNYCESAEGQSLQSTSDFRVQMQNYQKLFQDIDEFFRSNTSNKKSVVSVIELINSASRYLKSGNFDLAVIDFQSCLQQSDLSDSQLWTVHSGLSQAFTATGHQKQAADSLMSSVSYMTTSSSPETHSKEQAAICLKAAAVYFKLRLFEDASAAYQTCLQCLEDCITIHDSSGGYSSSADTNVTMLYYIGKAGLAAAWIALRKSLREAAESLVHAANYFEKRSFELCCGPDGLVAPNLTQRLATLSPLIQHLCTSYDSLGNCSMLLASSYTTSADGSGDDEEGSTATAQRYHDNCDFVCDRTITCCNALVCLFDAHYYSSATATTAAVPESVVSVMRLLRTRRAYAYFAKARLYTNHSLSHTNIVADADTDRGSKSAFAAGVDPSARDLKYCFHAPLPVYKLNTRHTLNADHHVTVFENMAEALMTYYDYAGGEYGELDNLLQGIACYQNLGGLMMTESGVEPFQTDRGDVRVDDVILERGHDVWRQVASLSDRHIVALKSRPSTAANTHDTSNNSSGDLYYYQQQSLLALFNAGLFATHYDLTLAQRAFEAGLSVRDAINSVQRFTSSDKPHNYYITLGDLSHHVGHIYLRVGKLDYAVSEAWEALHCYHYREAPAVEQRQQREEVPRPGEGLTLEQREDVDRTRVRQSYSLLAVALSCRGQSDLAEEVMDIIRAGCIGPIEDGDKEVKAVRRLIEQRKPKPSSKAARTPTVASFMKPSDNTDDAVDNEDVANKSATATTAPAEDRGGASNIRMEKFASEDDVRERRRELVMRFLDVAKNSPAFMWCYRRLKPVISLVLSLIYRRGGAGNSTGIRNNNDSGNNNPPQEVDYKLILSYSILGAILGILIGIVIKVYDIY